MNRKKKSIYLDELGSNNNPVLSEIKRHGHFPPTNRPLGWDEHEFRKIFPTKDLPFQDIDIIGTSPENRLIWGDNLAVMRSLPSESLDMIYIDPPFFSGRNYNKIFGDEDEERTFRDIWDGGLETYLAWMNARLYEMKRILNQSGSIFVHVDWHAAHYIKIELDKIFGYENFINEIIWGYNVGGKSKKHFARKHDNILWYSKTKKYYFDNKAVRVPMESGTKSFGGRLETDTDGRKYRLVYGTKNKKGESKYYKYYLDEGKIPEDYWVDINSLQSGSKERIGYPTQKPEKLIERLIKAACPVDGKVGDFFCGGGTTATVAQKHGRKWLTTDISRIAIQVASDRIQNISPEVGIEIPSEKDAFQYSHKIQYHGVYLKDKLRELTEKDFIEFILKCYQSDPDTKSKNIHGTKSNYAIFVGPANGEITHTHVMKFYKEMKDNNFRYGQMLGWRFTKKAKEELERIIASNRNEIRDIQPVKVNLVDIDSDEFKGNNIRFVSKPMANIRNIAKKKQEWEFDASNSAPQSGARILQMQWDFNYNGKFSTDTEWNFKDSKNKDESSGPANKIIVHKFVDKGEHQIALRIIDSKGGMVIHPIKVAA